MLLFRKRKWLLLPSGFAFSHLNIWITEAQLRWETHNTPNIKTSTTWSHKGQCWAFYVETQSVELDRNVQVAGQRKRDHCFQAFHPSRWALFLPHNVISLFEVIWIACNPSVWCLLINSSSRNLKAVSPPHENMYSTLALTQLVQLKENYSSATILIDAFKYEVYHVSLLSFPRYNPVSINEKSQEGI